MEDFTSHIDPTGYTHSFIPFVPRPRLKPLLLVERVCGSGAGTVTGEVFQVFNGSDYDRKMSRGDCEKAELIEFPLVNRNPATSIPTPPETPVFPETFKELEESPTCVAVSCLPPYIHSPVSPAPARALSTPSQSQAVRQYHLPFRPIRRFSELEENTVTDVKITSKREKYSHSLHSRSISVDSPTKSSPTSPGGKRLSRVLNPRVEDANADRSLNRNSLPYLRGRLSKPLNAQTFCLSQSRSLVHPSFPSSTGYGNGKTSTHSRLSVSSTMSTSSLRTVLESIGAKLLSQSRVETETTVLSPEPDIAYNETSFRPRSAPRRLESVGTGEQREFRHGSIQRTSRDSRGSIGTFGPPKTPNFSLEDLAGYPQFTSIPLHSNSEAVGNPKRGGNEARDQAPDTDTSSGAPCIPKQSSAEADIHAELPCNLATNPGNHEEDQNPSTTAIESSPPPPAVPTHISSSIGAAPQTASKTKRLSACVPATPHDDHNFPRTNVFDMTSPREPHVGKSTAGGSGSLDFEPSYGFNLSPLSPINVIASSAVPPTIVPDEQARLSGLGSKSPTVRHRTIGPSHAERKTLRRTKEHVDLRFSRDLALGSTHVPSSPNSCPTEKVLRHRTTVNIPIHSPLAASTPHGNLLLRSTSCSGLPFARNKSELQANERKRSSLRGYRNHSESMEGTISEEMAQLRDSSSTASALPEVIDVAVVMRKPSHMRKRFSGLFSCL